MQWRIPASRLIYTAWTRSKRLELLFWHRSFIRHRVPGGGGNLTPRTPPQLRRINPPDSRPTNVDDRATRDSFIVGKLEKARCNLGRDIRRNRSEYFGRLLLVVTPKAISPFENRTVASCSREYFSQIDTASESYYNSQMENSLTFRIVETSDFSSRSESNKITADRWKNLW